MWVQSNYSLILWQAGPLVGGNTWVRAGKETRFWCHNWSGMKQQKMWGTGRTGWGGLCAWPGQQLGLDRWRFCQEWGAGTGWRTQDQARAIWQYWWGTPSGFYSQGFPVSSELAVELRTVSTVHSSQEVATGEMTQCWVGGNLGED